MATQDQQPENGLPPFIGTWKQFYVILVIWLLVLIVLFYLFSKAFE
jgi:hypothetical protein